MKREDFIKLGMMEGLTLALSVVSFHSQVALQGEGVWDGGREVTLCEGGCVS